MNSENNQEKPKINFQYLIPSKNAEKVDTYIDALEEAIEEEDVNNIAIAGTYGAGKSSFIKTFINKKDKYHYLDISLATFEKNTKDMSLVEKSILQQIFYKVEQNQIPQSRFKRINTISSLGKKSIIVLLFILSILFITKSKYVGFLDFLNKKISFSETICTPTFSYEVFTLIPITIILIGLFFIIKSIIKNYSGFALEKLNLQNLEIKTNKDEESSLLNNYLDEILYFFSQTDYNIVIFQDLDRFKNIEIFTKLRELNNFLNNSEQVRQKHGKIVFLYAIKDSMFNNGDSRTKFFDFMIPIIPYINSSTSYEKLLEFFENDLKSFKDKEKKDFEDFLRDISLYINDMRLLKNIYNEFKIYDEKIGDQLDKVKLLAIIIYKNFYPEDFGSLYKDKGILSSLFKNKNLYIKQVDDSIKQEVLDIQKEIHTIKEENEHFNNINELRSLYVFEIIKNLEDGLYSNRYIKYPDGTYVSPEDAIKEENFQKLVESKNLFGSSTYNSTTFSIAEEKLSDISYQEREDIILNRSDNKIKKLENQINELRKKQKQISKSSLQDLLHLDEGSNIFESAINDNQNNDSENTKNIYELLELLVINGHIDEDYYLYLSYSFNKSLTPQDTTFIKSVISSKILDSNFKLTNLEEILNRLNITQFKNRSILNYDLISFLIENKTKYNEQYETIFEQLSNEDEESIQFIFGYLESLPMVNNFITEIVSYWDNFWTHIIDNDFSSQDIEDYFYLLLYNVSSEKIEHLNKDNNLKKYIENLTKLRDLETQGNNSFKALIKLLDIKFNNLNEPITNTPLFSYIYENSHYEINEVMIQQIFKFIYPIDYDADYMESLLKTQNLSTIFTNERKIQKLFNYISNNLSSYVDDMILSKAENTLESSDTIVWLLNRDDLNKEQKFKIIESQENKLDEGLLDITDEEILNEIFSKNKANAHWDNVSHYYNIINTLNKALIEYLSVIENAEELSKTRISTKYCEENENFNTQLLREIAKCDKLNDSSYTLLIKSNGYWYKDLDLCKLGENKIDILIKNTMLQLTTENIDKLIECSLSKHIVLIENLFDAFIEKFDEVSTELTPKDFAKLFNSNKLTNEQKFILLEHIDFEKITIDKELATSLAELYLNKNESMSKELLEDVIAQLLTNKKLEVLVHQLSHTKENYTCDDINRLLEYLGEPYNQLCNRQGSHKAIPKDEKNETLAKILKKLGCISTFTKRIGSNKIRINRFGS
jgi:hypothetical protein